MIQAFADDYVYGALIVFPSPPGRCEIKVFKKGETHEVYCTRHTVAIVFFFSYAFIRYEKSGKYAFFQWIWQNLSFWGRYLKKFCSYTPNNMLIIV